MADALASPWVLLALALAGLALIGDDWWRGRRSRKSADPDVAPVDRAVRRNSDSTLARLLDEGYRLVWKPKRRR